MPRERVTLVGAMNLQKEKRLLVDFFERWAVLRALKKCRGNKSKAARYLEMDGASFRRLLRRLGCARGPQNARVKQNHPPT